MELFGMPYIAAYLLPFSSGWPVTSAVIFAVCELAQARMKMSEMEPRPTAAKPTGLDDAALWAGDGNRVAARASAEVFAKWRRFIFCLCLLIRFTNLVVRGLLRFIFETALRGT